MQGFENPPGLGVGVGVHILNPSKTPTLEGGLKGLNHPQV